MKRSYQIFTLSTLLILVFLPSAADAQLPKPANSVEAVLMEHALSADELAALVGKTANMLLISGKRENDIVLKEFVTARYPDMPRMIGVTRASETRPRRFPTSQLFQIEIDNAIYRVNTIPSQKAAVLQDMSRHEEQVREQLRGGRNALWEKYDEDQQTQFVAEEKEFLQQVRDHFRTLPMQLHETQYFLFLTDMPPGQVGPYLLQLDQMNEMLGTAFGFAPGENVWRGKSVVIAFVAKASFQEFEQVFMNNPDTATAQGLCHSYSNGRVVTSCYRGDDPSFFAVVLVHETAHGYVHRYLSTAYVPSWVNEGIAEWVARAVVPRSPAFRQRQQEANAILQQAGALNGFFAARQIEPWHYGVALPVVDLLMKENPAQFRIFFNGIKEGLPWEDSLMRAYGMTPQGLAIFYGRSIGLPMLAE